MKRILVTGCGGPAAINFIKSIRMADEPIYVVGTDSDKIYIELSNSDTKHVVPRCNESTYVEAMNEIINKECVELFHPQPDIEVKVVSDNREKFDAKTFLPDKRTIDICQNKMEFNKELKRKDVPVPQSFILNKKGDIEKYMSILLQNNEKAWVRAIEGAGSRAALPTNQLDITDTWINYWDKRSGIGYGRFMMSEFLPGKEFAFQSIWKDGEIITSQARERMAYIFSNFTVSGQSSSPSIAKTVHRDDVNDIATRAVKAVDKNATGIFCVDLKENITGVPCVTEINAGRFFTTSNFFSEAGCNMPYYYVKMALGEELPDLNKYNSIPENIYWIRLIDCGHVMLKQPKF